MGNISTNKIAVTGSTGILGRELSRYLSFIPVTRDMVDIRNKEEVEKTFKEIDPDVTVHLAAISRATDAEANMDLAYDTNVLGTRNVSSVSKHIIYISTDYVFNGEDGYYNEKDTPDPQTYIGLTKYLGELEAKKAKRYTIIRTSFKEIPYRHPVAPVDMFTSADYVPIIAYHIANCIKHASELPEILHVGTERKTIVTLARKTRQVQEIVRDDISISLPYDCSLDTSLYDRLCSNWE